MRKTTLFAVLIATIFLAGCLHAPRSQQQPTATSGDQQGDTTMVTGTTREAAYPLQDPDLEEAVTTCYEQHDPNTEERSSCVAQANAQFTVSKTGACQLDNGFHNRHLTVQRSAGNAESTSFYKDGTGLYYPVQISTADNVSCERQDYELYLYTYNCTTQEATQLTFLNEEITDNLRMCALQVIGKSEDALLAKIYPYERGGRWLDNYLIFDADDGSYQAVNVRGESDYSDLGVLAEEGFVGFDQFTSRVKENTAPYYTTGSDPIQTGTGITNRGRIEVDNIDQNLQGTLRHIYQVDTQGAGPYRFVVTEGSIDFLTREIGQ